MQALQVSDRPSDNGADADEAHVGILVEQFRRQGRPDERVQVVPEIGRRRAEIDKLHAVTFQALPVTYAGDG